MTIPCLQKKPFLALFIGLFLFMGIFFIGFSNPVKAQSPPKLAYDSPSLKVKQLTDHTYQHISYLQTENWGAVACNGLIYVHQGKAIVFDTPSTDSVAQELIAFIKDQLQAKIKAVVINHFHIDCLGGLEAFHKAKVTSYANARTIDMAMSEGSPKPKQTFKKEKTLRIGGEKVILFHPGRAHTSDNIVGYVPSERVLFGGCMLKSLTAGRGNLNDATVQEWTSTILKVEKRFPEANILVPGHGKAGDRELLKYTQEMFYDDVPFGVPNETGNSRNRKDRLKR